MFKDHEFDPVTPEEEARRRQEEEFARRVRREVLRIERGEADEDIRADMEREEEEKAEEEERQRPCAHAALGLRRECPYIADGREDRRRPERLLRRFPAARRPCAAAGERCGFCRLWDGKPGRCSDDLE